LPCLRAAINPPASGIDMGPVSLASTALPPEPPVELAVSMTPDAPPVPTVPPVALVPPPEPVEPPVPETPSGLSLLAQAPAMQKAARASTQTIARQFMGT
jgi:hypothetical protein